MNIRSLVLFTAITVLAMAVMSANNRQGPSARASTIPYSEFLASVEAGNVSSVRIQDNDIFGERVNGDPFRTYAPNDPGLMGDLLDAGVRVNAVPPSEPSFLLRLFVSAFPILLLIAVFIYIMRRQGLGGQGGGNPFQFGKSNARKIDGGQVPVRLSDVAGVEEAKEDVGELVDFLRSPDKYQALGGAIPRGVLMVGPPGTGKTLLARAIAGEAGVPFFSVSGSDFVEMFVGVGASRVRDLFKQARENAPCIIFVDEIDAVGRRRGAGFGGGHDEREQTLNQLLVEMDGFEGKEGIIVVAATNRPDVLDPALLRPGRFDRQVVVGLPDLRGRAQILRVHMRKVPIANDVDPSVIARGTPGFSGADLANLVNEAALFSARSNRSHVDMEAFERAKDKLLMGAERRSMVMSEDDKRRTAYHEAGHVIIGRLMPDHDPVHKVSIIPRGRALGVTLFLPERDRWSLSKRQLDSQIASLFGGRLAEELVYGPDGVTTGASNDIERATKLARDMVTKWGLCETMGPLSYDDQEDEVFLGNTVTQRKSVSNETAERIDEAVRAIINRNYTTACALLEEHRAVLDAMAQALVAHETLDSEQIDVLMPGGSLPPPDAGDDSPPYDSSGASSQSPTGSSAGRPAVQHSVKTDIAEKGRRA